MGHNQQWFNLFGNHYGNTFVEYMSKIGGEWYTTKERITYISNEFWLKVFEVAKSYANCKNKKQKQIQISFSHVFGIILNISENLCISKSGYNRESSK